MSRIHSYPLCFLLLVFNLVEAKAQSREANYIKTETFTSETETSSQITIDYLDEKGRLSQRVSNNLGNGNFLRTCYSYDTNGRLHRESLPLDSQSDIAYKKIYDLSAESEKTYQGDKYGYTEFKYDALGNIVSTLGPGFDWFDDERDIACNYLTNLDNEVKKYDISPKDGTLIISGFYAKGELCCIVTTDEDWKSSKVYYDNLGRKILERQTEGENHDTYFVYDQLNRLCLVLTPQFQKEGNIQLFAYQYAYDNRGRLVSKVIPSCDKTEYWYDSADRLVLMQNARLRSKGRYRFYMYDTLNRLCIMGNCTEANNIEQRNDIKYQSNASGIGGTEYICLGNASLQDITIEEVRYYDSYDFLQRSLLGGSVASNKLHERTTLSNSNTSIQLSIEKNQTKGLLTGKVQHTSSGETIGFAHYYDGRGRLVETTCAYGENRTLLIGHKLNYVGQVSESMSLATSGETSYSLSTRNFYQGETGKMLSCELSINGAPFHAIASYNYDNVGRIQAYQQGKSTTSYKYNTRNWLRKITSPGLDEELMYTYYEINEGTTDCFNGDLSVAEFTLPNSRKRHHVEYNYDELRRVTGSMFYENSDGYIDKNGKYDLIVNKYDLNGNILNMQRYGKKDNNQYGLVDDLTLNYTGNQLISVTDKADEVLSYGTTDFKDGNHSGIDYSYDKMGAMSSDKNKGISMMEYDLCNFPHTFLLNNGHKIEYDYTPDGSNLKITHSLVTPEPFSSYPLSSSELDVNSVTSSETIEYLGNFVLRNGKLEKVLFLGGYASMDTGDAIKYHYFTHDQQGNVRAVFDDNGKVEQILTYDALGNIIPELSENVGFQPYAFNGKEIDCSFGLNLQNFGYRMYDSALGRWTSVDRKNEDYISTTPYAFCQNNFVNGIDLFGLDYWSTSNPDLIRRFVSQLKNGRTPTDLYNSFETHLTDAQFTSNISYNDEKKQYYLNVGRVENGVATCIGITLKAGERLGIKQTELLKATNFLNILLIGPSGSIGTHNELIKWALKGSKSKSVQAGRQLISESSDTFAKYWKLSQKLGNRLGWISVGTSFINGIEHFKNGEDFSIIFKDALDAGIGIFSIYGGPVGLAVGTAYTLYNIYKESETSKKY